MALYSASYSLMTMVLFLPRVISTVATSVLNERRGSGAGPEYRQAFWMNLGATAIAVVAGAAGIALCARPMLAAFGRDFAPSGVPVLLILLTATLPEGLTLAISQIVQSNATIWLSVVAINVPRDSVIVALAAILVTQYGARGCVLGADLLFGNIYVPVLEHHGYGLRRLWALCYTARAAGNEKRLCLICRLSS